jgi:hypothetical protein
MTIRVNRRNRRLRVCPECPPPEICTAHVARITQADAGSNVIEIGDWPGLVDTGPYALTVTKNSVPQVVLSNIGSGQNILIVVADLLSGGDILEITVPQIDNYCPCIVYGEAQA